MDFSSTQQIAYDHYLNGDNVFITGPGGTGKSYFIKKVYENAKKTELKCKCYRNDWMCCVIIRL